MESRVKEDEWDWILTFLKPGYFFRKTGRALNQSSELS
jgi:hypothetical protein